MWYLGVHEFSIELHESLLVYWGVVCTALFFGICFAFTNQKPAWQLVTHRALPRYPLPRQSCVAESGGRWSFMEDSFSRRESNDHIAMDNSFAFAQYGIGACLIVSGIVHLVSRRTSDSDATLDDLTLFGVTAVLMGELWLLVIHPFAVCNMIFRSAYAVGYTTTEMMDECDHFAIRAELTRQMDPMSGMASISSAATADHIRELRERVQLAVGDLVETQQLWCDLYHSIQQEKFYASKEATYIAHYQLRVLAAATTAEVHQHCH